MADETRRVFVEILVNDGDARARVAGVDTAIAGLGKTAAQATKEFNALFEATGRTGTAAGTTTKQTEAATTATKTGTAAVVAHGEALAKTTQRYAENQAGLVRVTNLLRTVGRDYVQAGAAMSMYITAPMVAATAASLHFATQFETSTTKLVTLSAVSESEMAKMRQGMLDMAPAVGVGPNALAEAMLRITSIGLRQAAPALEILGLAAKGSAAGLGDVIKVADTVTSAMNAYKGTTLTAAEATNVLYGVVIEGKGELDQFAGAMGRIVGMAATVGVSLADVGALFAAYTRMGVSASEAVTGVRRALFALSIQEAKQTGKALAELGLDFDQLRAKIAEQGLTRTLVELAESFKGNWNALHNLFPNIRGLNAALSVTGNQAGSTLEILDKLTKGVYKVDDGFSRSAETMQFQWNQVKATFEALGIQFGSALFPAVQRLIPAMQGLMDKATGVVDWFSNLSRGAQDVVLGFFAMGAALGPLIFTIGNFARIIGAVVDTIIFLKKVEFGTMLKDWGTAALGVSKALFGVQSALAAILVPVAITATAVAVGKLASSYGEMLDAQEREQKLRTQGFKYGFKAPPDPRQPSPVPEFTSAHKQGFELFATHTRAVGAAAKETTAYIDKMAKGWDDLRALTSGTAYKAEFAGLSADRMAILNKALTDGATNLKTISDLTGISVDALQWYQRQLKSTAETEDEATTALTARIAAMTAARDVQQDLAPAMITVGGLLVNQVKSAGEAGKQFGFLGWALQGVNNDGFPAFLEQAPDVIRTLDSTSEKTQSFGDKVVSLGKVLSSVFSHINSTIGQVGQIVGNTLEILGSKTATATEKAVAAFGALAQLAQMSGHSTLSAGLSGAGAGAALGSIIPGVGTAVGAVVGGIAGLFGGSQSSKKQQEAQLQQMQAQARETQQALIETYGSLAQVNAIGEIVGVTMTGIWDTTNIVTMRHLETQVGQFTAALEALDTRLQSVSTSMGLLTDAEIRQMQQLRAAGFESDAMRDFTATQTGRISTGANAIVGGFASPWLRMQADAEAYAETTDKLGSNILDLQAKIADMDAKGGPATEQQARNYLKWQESVKALNAELTNVILKHQGDGVLLEAFSKDGQAAFERYGRVATMGFAAALVGGQTFFEALETMKPSLTSLTTLIEKFGFNADETLKTLLGWSQFAEAQPEIASSIDGLNQMLTGLHNTGMLNETMFRDLGAVAYDTFHRMELAGKGGTDGARAMQPALQTLWQIWKDTGWVVDDNTRKLLEFAETNGIVGEQFKDPARKQVEALQGIQSVLGDLTKFFKEDFVKAVIDAFAEAERRARETAAAIATSMAGPFPVEIPVPGQPGSPGPSQPEAPQAHLGSLIGGANWSAAAYAHRGLGVDEVPIIAQRGERVLSRDDTRRLERMGGLATLRRGGARSGGGAPQVTVPVTIQAWDALSVQEWLQDGGADTIARAIVPAIPGVVMDLGLDR